MKNSSKIILSSLSGFGASFAAAAYLSISAFAAVNFNGNIETGAQQAKGQGVPSILFGGTGIFTQVVNIMLFLIGILSVIMLIFGGLRYVISGGNSKTVESAKNTILYAIVGLIVAILAYAIVNFVIGIFMNDSGINSGGSTNGIAPTNV